MYSSGKIVGGMLFVNDFEGVSDSKESLQKLIDVVYHRSWFFCVDFIYANYAREREFA